jgi:hypothetical protein
MDEEPSGRRRLKVAGIAAAAVLAVPGGMAISNAFAADGGDASSSSTPAQAIPAQGETPAPQQERGDRDHGDCPGKGGGQDDQGGGQSGATGTGYTMQ